MIQSFPSSDAAAIKVSQELFNNTDIEHDLKYITSNFGFLPAAIEALEESGEELVTQIHLVTNIISNLNSVENDVGKRVSAKMKTMLDASDGYQILSKIADVLLNKCSSSSVNISCSDMNFFNMLRLYLQISNVHFLRIEHCCQITQRDFLSEI